MSLKKSLPGVYEKFINPEILNIEITETKATCDNCLRSRDGRFEYLYKPELKCCTFFPFLPNYAVGGIIHKKLSGANVVKHKILKNEFAIPIGLYPTLKYQYDFQTKAVTDFGNKKNLLCPYYDTINSNCSIWEFRGTVCTTFFCRSDYGKKGIQFWDNLNEYLSYVEMALAEECLVMMDFSPRDVSDQLTFMNQKEFTLKQETQKSLSEKDMKMFWNGYKSPEDFYLMCYSMAMGLTKKQFSEIIGERGKTLEKNVLELYKSLPIV